MTRARSTLAAVAVLALLTACGGTADGGTTPSSAPSTTPSSTPSTTSGSTTPTPGTGSSDLPTSLVALQLCGTTLGYAAGALAGMTADQLATMQAGVTSAQAKAGTAEAELLAQSQAVVAAAATGDQAAISAAGKKMGELCGAG